MTSRDTMQYSAFKSKQLNKTNIRERCKMKHDNSEMIMVKKSCIR